MTTFQEGFGPVCGHTVVELARFVSCGVVVPKSSLSEMVTASESAEESSSSNSIALFGEQMFRFMVICNNMHQLFVQ